VLFSTLIAEKIIANPYQKIQNIEYSSSKHIRIRGIVTNGKKGIANVILSDGETTCRTNQDGEFEIISNENENFIFLSQPSGYEIQTNDKGIASFYRKIEPDNNNEMYVEFSLKESRELEKNYSFLMLADPQTLDNVDMELLHLETVPDIQKVIKDIRNVSFGVSCGDIMYDDLSLFPQYIDAVNKLGIPFFQVFGNHDAEVKSKTDEQSSKTFEKYFGPAYYSFNKGEVHYIILDDIFWYGSYIGYLTEKQLNWLRQDLAHIENGKTVVAFVHIPPYTELPKRSETNISEKIVISNRELLYQILERHNAYILCGHMHFSEYLRERNLQIHIGGAVCGAWWTGPICSDGTPNGYSIYNVRGSALSWEYKATGHQRDHQMKVYRPDSDLNPSDEFIVNVWTANEKWRVYWYEDGIRVGSLERRNSIDPLANKLYLGSEIPEKHKWVEPTMTDHLFYFKPKDNRSKITIEVISEFDKIYKTEF
jgi:predicted phosphodiesterase